MKLNLHLFISQLYALCTSFSWPIRSFMLTNPSCWMKIWCFGKDIFENSGHEFSIKFRNFIFMGSCCLCVFRIRSTSILAFNFADDVFIDRVSWSRDCRSYYIHLLLFATPLRHICIGWWVILYGHNVSIGVWLWFWFCIFISPHLTLSDVAMYCCCEVIFGIANWFEIDEGDSPCFEINEGDSLFDSLRFSIIYCSFCPTLFWFSWVPWFFLNENCLHAFLWRN